jgi:tRNA/rRNA methyltransferase
MKTMGLSKLYLVSPERPVDDEARTRATGAVDVLDAAIICDRLDEALTGVVSAAALTARVRELGPPLLDARSSAGQLAGVLNAVADGDVALVFGNETSGLSNDEVVRCDRAVTIPTNPEFWSLNLGAAAQVLCYEMRLAIAGQGLNETDVVPFETRPARREEIDGFLDHLEQALIRSGFQRADKPTRLMPKLRRLFDRAALEREEVNILRGIIASLEMAKAKRAGIKVGLPSSTSENS